MFFVGFLCGMVAGAALVVVWAVLSRKEAGS